MKFLLVYLSFIISCTLFGQLAELDYYKAFSGLDPTANETPYSLTSDNNGNAYFSFNAPGFIDLEIGGTTQAYFGGATSGPFVIKYNQNGDSQWVIHTGYTSDHTFVKAMDVDDLGNLYLLVNLKAHVGFEFADTTVFISTLADYDHAIIKVDTDGNYITHRQYYGDSTNRAKFLKIESGYLYSSGQFKGAVNFDVYGTDTTIQSSFGEECFLQKLDLDLNIEWTKTFVGNKNEDITDMSIDPSGNVFLSIAFDSLIDLEPNIPGGEIIGDHPSFGAYGPGWGPYGSRILVKFDSNGSYEWSVQPDKGIGKIECLDNGNILYTTLVGIDTDVDPGSGQEILNRTGNYSNPCVVTLSGLGHYLQSNHIKTYDNNSVRIYDLKSNVNNDYFLFTTGLGVFLEGNGIFSSDVSSFSYGPNSYPLSIVKYNQSGNDCKISQISAIHDTLISNFHSNPHEICLDENGSIYGSLDLYSSISFFMGGNVETVVANGSGRDAFFFKMSQQTLSTNEIENENESLLLYPNPNSGIFKLNLDYKDLINVKVFNSSGKIICEQKEFNSDEFQFDLLTGLYFLQVNLKGYSETLKFIVE